MRLTIKALFCVMTMFAFLAHPALADFDEGDVRLGISAGNVDLTGQVGEDFGNALAYGIHFNYAATDVMFFDVSYNSSTHDDDLSRTAIDVGVLYYGGSYDALLWNLSAGGSFINHNFTLSRLSTNEYTTDAFAVYVGAGADFMIGENFITGIQARYYNAFPSSVNIEGTDYDAITNSGAVFLKLLFTL